MNGDHTADGSRPRRERRINAAVYLGIFTLVLAAWLPALRSGLIWDDYFNVILAPERWTWLSLRDFFLPLDTDISYLRPLPRLSFQLDELVWGASRLWGWHLTNVVWHAMNAVLVAVVARPLGRFGAVTAAMVFGLHPLATETVSWISARPDLLVYTLLVPVCMTVFGADREAKRNGLWALALTVAAIGVQITGSWYLLRSPLPLSFYAKGMVGYGDIFASHYRLVPFVELTHYVASYWPLLLVIGLDLVVSRRQWRSGISPVERALLVATCLFVLYYAFFVLQIMHRPQRFYYPTLPALVFLAAQGGARLAGAIPKPISAELERLPRWAVVGFAILLGGLLLRPAVTAAVELRRKATRGRLLNFDVVANYRDRYTDYWFGLDAFSDLPDDLVVATTEIGRPAALNPHKQIVDMTGLNERAFAHEGFSADRLLLNHRPDLIYMPHPHYEDMATQLIKHPVFAAQYERFSGAELGAEMGLALRRESRYYRHMARIVRERIQHTHRRPH